MSGATYERELKSLLTKQGWLVFRSAGSFACDLIALKPNDHKLIEVKSTKANNANLNHDDKARAQFDILNNLAKEGFNVYYYIRWKRRKPKWSKYQLPLEPYPILKHKNIKEENKCQDIIEQVQED